jgi:chorismate synthase
MQKFDFTEARPILERASARETAARVALGEVARQFLRQGLGMEILSHVVGIGPIRCQRGGLPTTVDRDAIDADPVRCLDSRASRDMQDLVAATVHQGDTLGGVIEVVVWGSPPGLGTHISPDQRLDARLAGALMGIQAIKGVEIGDGFGLAQLHGSDAHDQIHVVDGRIRRAANRAGGIEGGISNGEPIVVRAAMKPIATIPHALATVDIATGENACAHHQRSDVCAVPAAGVVGEAVVALVLAQAVREKFGGDTLHDVQAAVSHYRTRLRAAGMEGTW